VLVLLGPQRFDPDLASVVRSLGIEGPIAVVTAGWQERESEDTALRDHLGRDVFDLRLYHRMEDVLDRDPELAGALHERQDALRELQELYRLRLSYALGAARDLMRRAGGGPRLEGQRRAAIRGVQTLDRLHLRQLRRTHEAFARRWRPAERDAVARHRAQIARMLERVGALCVAGGHVAVLLGRLRLFDLPPLLGGRPVIAWSAGAMAVTERVVLFHDSPPQGTGNAEVLDAGLGLAPGVVALPHARRRLRLEDPVRVALFARRFGPATCVALEPGSRMDWDGRSWTAGPTTCRLDRRGTVGPVAGR
jgi:hypothetical protein